MNRTTRKSQRYVLNLNRQQVQENGGGGDVVDDADPSEPLPLQPAIVQNSNTDKKGKGCWWDIPLIIMLIIVVVGVIVAMVHADPKSASPAWHRAGESIKVYLPGDAVLAWIWSVFVFLSGSFIGLVLLDWLGKVVPALESLRSTVWLGHFYKLALKPFFTKVGEYIAYVSSFYIHLKLEELVSSFVGVASWLGKIGFSWVKIGNGYKFAISVYYASSWPTSVSGTATLVALVCGAVYAFMSS